MAAIEEMLEVLDDRAVEAALGRIAGSFRVSGIPNR
jgi:hypothetical protein